MKRILLSLTAIFVVMTIAAKTQFPRTVQGVPYTPKAADGKLRAASDWEWATPDDMAGDANFTFDMIKNWTGEGENKAALVIQWNYDDEPAALVFGYRWTGQATGADMLKAVVKNNPRLYALMQYTNVSSPTDPNGGYTLNGIGWDVDDDGDIALIDTGNGNQVYESEDGFFEHPRGYKPGQGGSSDYDYDNWKARDTDDMWGAGWYSSYWSYWVKDNAKDKFSYSSWGVSARVLENGSWDGWNFAKGMMSSEWKSFVAAPLPIPADAKTVFVNEGLRYELKSYSAKTVKLTAPETGVYTGEVAVPSTLTSIEAYAFRGCKAVGTLVLPESLSSLPSYVFENAGLNRLVLPQKKMNYNNTNLVYGCTGIKVYSPVTEPGTTVSYTWRVKNGSPATFAEIVVPAGCESAYSSIYYWGKSKLTALQLEGIQLVEGSAKKVGGNLVISGRIAGTYDDAHAPAAFTQFNDGVLFKGKTVKVVCKMTSATLDIAKAASMTETTVGDDATFTVTMPDTENADMLRLIVQYEDNGSTYTAGYPEMINVEKTFAFTDAEYDAHFDESFTPTLEFYSDAYSLDKIEFSSSDTKVASVNKRTGAVSVKRVEGDAVITAALKTDPAVKATMTVHAALRNPVTGFVLGNGDKTINLTYLDILALSPTVEPANADIQTYDVSVSDPEVATTYAARAFNPSRSFWELITHKTGTVDVTFTSQDGSGASTTYTVNVLEPNREPLADSYQNGTFWLNEDWFGHSNGSINYIADNGELKYRVYESQNKYESFGCTSQYGIIHGDKLIVMSKQATDGGDPRKGGGRVVVADAKTLKKLAAFDYIGADTDGDGNGDGDGRACVGVSENKVYLGSTAGIQVLDTHTLSLGGMVDGIASGANKYNGQIGDMVAIGKYAFAIQQGVGVHVIDIATDKVVKTFPVESNDASGMGYPQGITVTADGNVWVATTAGASSGLCTFRCIDPSTLDVTDSVDLPEGQRVTCGWGAWRSTNFFASKSENAIWYGAGVEASIVSGNTGYYKWTVGSDIAGIQPVFVFPNNLPGVDSKTFQAPYAGVRYDDRKNQLLVAATHGASSNYRYNWLHFVDCKTGDIVKTIKLKDYYWFPSMPIFPDKYAPEFRDFPEVSVDLAKDGDIFTIDLKDYVTDKDNIDAAIRLSIVGGDAVAADNTVSDKRLVNATLENGVLTITPLIAGHGNLNVKAESNGKTTTVSIPYAVEDSASGIHNVDGAAGTLSVCDNIVTVKNMAGTTFAVYDMAGRVVGAFVADSDCARVALTLPSGVYVVAATSGSHTLKFSIK